MILFLWTQMVVAQSPVPAEVKQGIGVDPFGTPPANETELAEQTHVIAKKLRCPVCQGLSVADSASDAALQMKGRIEELVAHGYTEAQIVDYFTDRYGVWVQLSPPKASHGMLWVMPWIASGLAIGGLGWWVTRAKSGSGTGKATGQTQTDEADPYRQQILDELGEQ